MKHVLARSVLVLLALSTLATIALLASVLFELRDFEHGPLLDLLGGWGIAFVLFLSVGLAGAGVLASWAAVRWGTLRPIRWGWLAAIFVPWVVGVLWLADWVLLEEPLTLRAQKNLITQQHEAAAVARSVDRARQAGDLQALQQLEPALDEQKIGVMLARIALNRPKVFEGAAVGGTIARYAARYDVDPVLLLSMLYVGSFYGEATSGPMPFFAGMNAETFRDLIQAHLPAWFVEAAWRASLIEQPYLESAFGQWAGGKLRYALHKATYDISVDPFETNTFSDLLLVLREFPEEFEDVLGLGAAADPLGRAFLTIRDSALSEPYEQPFVSPTRDQAYYERQREDLISFARAALYRLALDFDFAARVNALLVKYYAGKYQERLGPDAWDAMARGQRAALIGMLRDLFVPNIGRLGYNLYLLPELNCTPYLFVAEEALASRQSLLDPARTWHPQEAWKLWAGAGFKLRALSEVWAAATGQGLPGIRAADTYSAAVRVLASH